MELKEIHLGQGEHTSPEDGLCLLEAVAYFAGEKHSSRPECACPTLAAFGRCWNDSIRTVEERTRLLAPLIPRLIGSNKGRELSTKRSFLALDWLLRVNLPTWMDLLPALKEHASALRALPPQTSVESLQESRKVSTEAFEAIRAEEKRVNDGRICKERHVISFVPETALWLSGMIAARYAAAGASPKKPWFSKDWAALEVVAFNARAFTEIVARTAVTAELLAGEPVTGRKATFKRGEAAMLPTSKALRESAAQLFERMIEMS